jgi:hypothetical protein
MSQWGTHANNAANSVLWATEWVHLVPNTVNQANLYTNTTPDAWRNGNVAINAAIGQFGVSANVLSITNKATGGSEAKRVTHQGWNLRTQGTGPVKTYTINAGGSGYSNTDFIKVTPANANSAARLANAAITTNSSGGIISITPGFGGTGFVVNTASQLSFANSSNGVSSGTGANVTFTLGGRAGRVFYECLVAQVSTKGASGNTSILPG